MDNSLINVQLVSYFGMYCLSYTTSCWGYCVKTFPILVAEVIQPFLFWWLRILCNNLSSFGGWCYCVTTFPLLVAEVIVLQPFLFWWLRLLCYNLSSWWLRLLCYNLSSLGGLYNVQFRRFYLWGYLAFDFSWFCVVIRFFHPRQNGQWPPTSKDFYTRSYPLHYFWRKSQYFPFQCWVLNKGTTGTIFITYLVWHGPWLGIEPGTSRTRCLHSTTRLSWRWYTWL